MANANTSRPITKADIFKAAHVISAGKPVYRQVERALRTVNDADRTIQMVASTETEDRYGDVVRQDGWDLKNFKNNPVFLFSHRSEDPPIGQILNSTIEKGGTPALVQTIKFATKEIYPFADTIFKMYKGGFMNATSVGFMPKLYQPRIAPDDQGGEFLGYEFLEQELYELSAVPVPANPEALARVFKGVRDSGTFDSKTVMELFLKEAVERSVIDADEAGQVERGICGDTNPAWAYSVAGVTYNEDETVTADKAAKPVEIELKQLNEWKDFFDGHTAASTKCMKNAEGLVERLESAVVRATEMSEKLSATLEKIAGKAEITIADQVSEVIPTAEVLEISDAAPTVEVDELTELLSKAEVVNDPLENILGILKQPSETKSASDLEKGGTDTAVVPNRPDGTGTTKSGQANDVLSIILGAVEN